MSFWRPRPATSASSWTWPTGPDLIVTAQLASIGALAETSHAKCTAKPSGSLDTDDFRRAL